MQYPPKKYTKMAKTTQNAQNLGYMLRNYGNKARNVVLYD